MTDEAAAAAVAGADAEAPTDEAATATAAEKKRLAREAKEKRQEKRQVALVWQGVLESMLTTCPGHHHFLLLGMSDKDSADAPAPPPSLWSLLSELFKMPADNTAFCKVLTTFL